jgi:hypothetical protein
MVSCSSTKIVQKKMPNTEELRVVQKSLYESQPYEYLRSQYAKNSLLTEKNADSIATEMKVAGYAFADAQEGTQKSPILREGDKVQVVGKYFVEEVGDYVEVQTAQGKYLIPDNYPALLVPTSAVEAAKKMSKMDESKSVKKNTVAVSNPDEGIDYFNHTSERQRLSKVEWFCKTYSQYSKFCPMAVNKQVSVGMPEHLLALSWGKPSKIQEEGNDQGVFRVYIYPGNYSVNIKNGVVKSWVKDQ